MQDTAVLNSQRSQGNVSRGFLGSKPQRGARGKSQAKVQGYPSDPEGSSTKPAAVLLSLHGELEEAAGNVEFPPGFDRGWEIGEEQQEFRAMVSTLAQTQAQVLCVRQELHCPEPAPRAAGASVWSCWH